MRIRILKLLQPRSVSNGESRRLILARLVKLNDVVIPSPDNIIDIHPGDKIQIGKHEEIEITEEFLAQDIFHAK